MQPENTIDVNGSKWWYLHGKLHRTDGPAVERTDRDKEWWVNGERHRNDGPAIIWASGRKYWYLHGQIHSFDRWLEANTEILEEEKVMMKLQYG